MADVYAALDGKRLARVRVTFDSFGPWSADCDLLDDAEVGSGQVTLAIGDFELRGTVVEAQNGTYALQRRCRVVAGAGGWGTVVDPRHYHNDGGVQARTVAEDAARAAGETLGNFVPAQERVGVDYVRSAGPASRVVEDVVGAGVSWWVDADGVTHAGTRAQTTLDPDAYEVLAFDPRDLVATLSVDDPSAVTVGSVIEKRLDVARVVRSLEIVVDDDLRVIVSFEGADGARGKLASLLQSIVRRSSDAGLHGVFRYRVVRQSGDRLELQAVRSSAGLPDILPVSMWPGIAGAYCEPTPGSEVLVQFVEGDRTMPVVTGFVGPDGQSFDPVQVVLGGSEGSPVARLGDNVEVLLPPLIFSGTVGGVPATGVLTAPQVKTLGTITAGSSKIKAVT
jgi:hypothetical protein